MPVLTPFHVNWLVHLIHARHVRAAVAAHGRGRLLDVGCGVRPFDGLFARHCQRAVGVEPDRERYSLQARSAEGMIASAASETGRRQLPDAWASGLQLPFRDGCFDTVVCLQVLEHVPQPSRLLAEIARVLRPGGTLVLTTPHMWGIHEEPEDYYRFTPYGLRYLSGAVGLRVATVKALAGYWVTAGARFCHYLQQFEKLYLHPATRPMMGVVQVLCLLLDTLHRVESDAWNHLMIARKPGVRR